jgi:hypothetical protein
MALFSSAVKDIITTELLIINRGIEDRVSMLNVYIQVLSRKVLQFQLCLHIY